jgi:hypothetical protein
VSDRVVIVTGSRDWGDETAIHDALVKANPTLVVQGGASGADALARAWALVNGVPCRTFHASWSLHGRRAGPLRNGVMLRAFPHALVLAFPLDGPGTADCIRQARELRMTVIVYSASEAYP